MPCATRSRIILESLEERTCPTFVVQYTGSDLFISGIPTAGPTAAEQLSVRQTANNKFLIQDIAASGTKNLGSYFVGQDLFIKLIHYNTNVNVNLNGFTYGGNIVLSLGLGDTDTSTINPVSVFNGAEGSGSVLGNVLFLGGSGGEVFNVGQVGAAPSTPGPVTVGGNVTAVGRNVTSPVGNNLFLAPGSTVLGNVATSGVSGVDVGEITGNVTTVNGSVTVSGATEPNSVSLNVFGVVGGDVNLSGSALGDAFDLSQTIGAAGGIINGNLNVNLGYSANIGEFVTLAAGTLVSGNANITAQGGPNTGLAGGLYTAAGAVAGNLNLSIGEGDNAVAFTGSVNGNLQLTAGNGNNDLSSTPLSGTVGGSMNISLGNGTDTATITTAPNGLLNWTSGNGNDTLTLAPTANQVWNVRARFGNGDDSFNLAGTGMELLTGRIDGGGRLNGNSFAQSPNWVLASYLTLSNFS